MFNDNTIIQSIHNQNYTEAIKKIRLCFKETIESEDLIHSFIIGLLGLKANNCYEYMLQITKFNSYCSNETNKYSFSMNHTLFSFIKGIIHPLCFGYPILTSLNKYFIITLCLSLSS